MNLVKASKERIVQLKELLGPKVTLYLIDDAEHGRIWVETVPENARVLAQGLATFPEGRSDLGFLSVRLGENANSNDVIYIYREHGSSVVSLRADVAGLYHPLEKIWYTATMIPVALLYGAKWKRLG